MWNKLIVIVDGNVICLMQLAYKLADRITIKNNNGYL